MAAREGTQSVNPGQQVHAFPPVTGQPVRGGLGARVAPGVKRTLAQAGLPVASGVGSAGSGVAQQPVVPQPPGIEPEGPSGGRVPPPSTGRVSAAPSSDDHLPDYDDDQRTAASFASVFESHSWTAHTPEWLSPADFGVQNKRAARDLLFRQGQEMWPGQDDKRGVDVEASFFPLVRPRVNPAATTRGGGKVAATTDFLRFEPVPRQCQPPTTEVIPLEERRAWPAGTPLPMPPDMCRDARLDPSTGKMEVGTPYERLTAWCDSYFAGVCTGTRQLR